MKEAAFALGVSETTLKTFLRRAKIKLGAHNRVEMVLLHQSRHRSRCAHETSSVPSSEGTTPRALISPVADR